MFNFYYNKSEGSYVCKNDYNYFIICYEWLIIVCLQNNSFKKIEKFLVPKTDKTCQLNPHNHYGNVWCEINQKTRPTTSYSTYLKSNLLIAYTGLPDQKLYQWWRQVKCGLQAVFCFSVICWKSNMLCFMFFHSKTFINSHKLF